MSLFPLEAIQDADEESGERFERLPAEASAQAGL
jgi:hypothetical protein